MALEKFGKQFPGFEREVHGIELGADGEYWMRSVIESPGPASGKKAASPARNTKRKAKKTVPTAPIPKETR
jgi:arginine decarboxylase